MLLGHITDEEHRGVRQAPRQVAPERRNEHGAHLRASGGGDAQRAQEARRHQNAEHYLRDAIEWIEYRGSTAIVTPRHFPSVGIALRAVRSASSTFLVRYRTRRSLRSSANPQADSC